VGEIIATKGKIKKIIPAVLFIKEETNRLLDIIDKANS